MTDPDAPLRADFAALRREEAACAPRFETTLGAARAAAVRARPRPAPAWLLAGAVTAVALLLLARGSVPPGPGPSDDFAVGSWKTATDALLATPGAELLGAPTWEVPQVAGDPMGTAPRSGRGMSGRSHG